MIKTSSGAGTGAYAVTPHNTNPLATLPRKIYIGGAGNLKVTTLQGEEVTFTALPVGTILELRVKIIWATGTTATNIIAIY